MHTIEILKFGSSVLRTPGELHIAVDEIYRRWRANCRVLAVVSAFEGVTDQLISDASDLFGSARPDATAAYVATGEQRTAALLTGILGLSGIPARVVEPREIGLAAQGDHLESIPTGIDAAALERLWQTYPVLVLPGFYGINAQGHTVLFGRGGSDLSALFLAAELGGSCRLLKDVRGVFDADPARNPMARRFTGLSWTTAIEVAGPLIQPKALRYAQTRALAFDVGRPNERVYTRIGQLRDAWAEATRPVRALRIVLLGCGVVGRGVYAMLKRYPERFEIGHVVVGDVAKYPDITECTVDKNVVSDTSIDVVIECFGGVAQPYALISAALAAGKFVITANKAVVAAHWADLSIHARGAKRRLWYSAAVGGVLPALETLDSLASRRSPVREIRGILNGTCGVVLDALAEGRTYHDAIALAKAAGFAEADPTRDLRGLDSADKLALMIEASFGQWLAPENIPTRGIDTIAAHPCGFKLIARATQARDGITACVAPELVQPDSFMGQAKGPENRIEIELTCGEVIKLRGQGAGRWPTAVSVLGDLHEVARLLLEYGAPSAAHAAIHRSERASRIPSLILDHTLSNAAGSC
jgi:homoserine dehydrogenase